MIVLGAAPALDPGHGRLGSVAHQVLRHATCPVVVAR